MKLLNVAWLMLFFVNFESCHLAVRKSSNAGKLFSVTLVVFSGRPDPTWMISETTNPTLFYKIHEALHKGHGLEPSKMPEKLGYKGFLVSAKNDKKDYLLLGHHIIELQKALLESIPTGTISLNLKQHISENILWVNPLTITHSNVQPKRWATSYDRPTQQFWSSSVVTLRNNCYNYATDIPTFTFARPGRGTGRKYEKMTAVDVRNAAIRDGLIAYDYRDPTLPPPIPNDPARHLVALFVDEDIRMDFHWYRLDSNGYWSHKPGKRAPMNRDDNRDRIIDPRYANTDTYEFVAFMFVDKNSVKIL